MYTLTMGYRRKGDVFIKLVLILLGLVVGACLGLYLAAQTMPLPTTNVIYLTGKE